MDCCRLLLWLTVLLQVPTVTAQQPAVHPAIPVFHEGLTGTLVLVGGGSIPEAVREEFVRRLPADGVVVVLSAAAESRSEAAEAAVRWLKEAGLTQAATPDADNTSVSGTGDREQLSQQVCACLQTAAGVWICGGQQARLAAAYVDTPVERELQQLLARGGVIGGTSAGAAIMSRVMIASGKDSPELATGFDLLPDAIVDQHFTERQRLPRSRLAVAQHRDRFGLGIDEGTAVIVSGRTLQLVGRGAATILLPPAEHQPATEYKVAAGEQLDLTQLRRAVRARAAGVNPGEPVFGGPQIAAGALVIVGGGRMPQSVVTRFVELAGGPAARIVVLPTAVPRAAALRERVPAFFGDHEVAAIRVLPQSWPEEIAAEEFQSALQSATGIWFGGGRQWNFVDAYEGTNAVTLFRDVLARGGVIGGSSAGATIQGEYLVRGHPLGNTVMMAEGYERGFAFLPGTAIDQHFSQRGRRPDLLPVIRRHQRLLGIGIDEGTALVVCGTRAEVIGDHAAHFLRADRLQGLSDSELQEPVDDTLQRVYVTVPTGASIDLATLQTLPAEAAASE